MPDSKTIGKKRASAQKSASKTEKASTAQHAGGRLRELLDKNAASELLAELRERDVHIGELGGRVKDVAGQIWLAGLGAYAKVEKEGSKWFDTLVKDGERLEDKTRDLVDRQWSFYRDKVDDVRGKVEEVRDMATSSIDRIEKAFDERVASALARLNIPSKSDIDQLSRKVQNLQREVNALKSGAPGTAKKGDTRTGAAKAPDAKTRTVARKSGPKKSPTRKSATKKSTAPA